MENKPFQKKIAAAIVLLLLVGLGITGFVATQKKSTRIQEAGNPQIDVTQPAQKNSVMTTFDIESEKWTSQSTQTVSISFADLPSPPPTAVTLEIKFDPNLVIISSIKAGDLWSSTTELQNEIDSSNGVATVSFGQAFGAQASANKTIAKLTVTTKQSTADAKTSFQLGPKSAFARVGEVELIPLTSDPLMISIE
jgi:hypothetical protein